jgi:hypothetical protein
MFLCAAYIATTGRCGHLPTTETEWVTHSLGLVAKVPFLVIASASEVISFGECRQDRHVASLLAMTLYGFFNTPLAVDWFIDEKHPIASYGAPPAE